MMHVQKNVKKGFLNTYFSHFCCWKQSVAYWNTSWFRRKQSKQNEISGACL